MNARKECPVLEHTTANDELPDAARIGPAQLWAHFEDCLCFCRKVKSVFRFVVINPLQSVSVIEERHRTPRTVGDQAVKPAIQSLGKVRLLFISMN